MASYGQCIPYDAFGRVMRANMVTRRCPFHLERYPVPAAQRVRYVEAGFDARYTTVVDLAEYWRDGVDAAERARVMALETFDEFEEWDLLQGHYCVTLAVCSNEE